MKDSIIFYFEQTDKIIVSQYYFPSIIFACIFVVLIISLFPIIRTFRKYKKYYSSLKNNDLNQSLNIARKKYKIYLGILIAVCILIFITLLVSFVLTFLDINYKNINGGL